jgi:hypothetical protein
MNTYSSACSEVLTLYSSALVFLATASVNLQQYPFACITKCYARELWPYLHIYENCFLKFASSVIFLIFS